MQNETNNKVIIYWTIGTIVVIALFLGFWYWGNDSKVTSSLENNATTTENIDLDNEDDVIRPTDTSTTSENQTENPTQFPGFDYKG